MKNNRKIIKKKLKQIIILLSVFSNVLPWISSKSQRYFDIFSQELSKNGYKEVESLNRIKEQDKLYTYKFKAFLQLTARKIFNPVIVFSQKIAYFFSIVRNLIVSSLRRLKAKIKNIIIIFRDQIAYFFSIVRNLIVSSLRRLKAEIKNIIILFRDQIVTFISIIITVFLQNLAYPLIKVEKDKLCKEIVLLMLTKYSNLEISEKLAEISLEGNLTSTRSDKDFMRLIKDLIPFTRSKIKDFQKREKPLNENILLVNTVIWGSSFRKLFLNFCLSSLSTDGNFNGDKNWKPVFHIFTTESEKKDFKEITHFIESKLNGRIIIETFPDHFVRLASGDNRYWLFGGLSQLSMQLAYSWGCPIHFLNPDTVYSNNFFSNLKKLYGDGYQAVFSNSFRTDIKQMKKVLLGHKKNETLNISAQELSSLAVTYRLKMYDDCILSNNMLSGQNYPSVPVFINKAKNKLQLHTLHYQPLLIDMSYIEKNPSMNLFTVDSTIDNLIDVRVFNDERKYFVDGTEGIHYLELSPPRNFRTNKISKKEFLERFARNCSFMNEIQIERSINFPYHKNEKPINNLRSMTPNSFFKELKSDLNNASIATISADNMMEFDFGNMSNFSEINSVLYNLEARLKSTNNHNYYDAIIGKLTNDIQEFVHNVIKAKAAFNIDDIINFSDHCFRFDWLDIQKEIYDYTYSANYWTEAPKNASRKELRAFGEISKFILESQKNPKPYFLLLDGRSQQKKNNILGKQTFSYFFWGEKFLDLFCDKHIRCLLSEGNIPFLSKSYDIEVLILSDKKNVHALRENDVIQRLSRFARISFKVIPDEIIELITSQKKWFYTLYGALDHVGIEEAYKNNSALFLLPVDSLVSSNFCRFVSSYSKNALIFGGGNIVFNEEKIEETVNKFRKKNGIINAKSSELLHAAIENAHQYFWSQLIHMENKNFGSHARETFIVTKDYLQINSIFIHPLYVTQKGLQQYLRKNYTNVDYGMIPRITDNADDIYVPKNIEEFYISNSCPVERLYEISDHQFQAQKFRLYHQNAFHVQRMIFNKPQKIKLNNVLTSFQATYEEHQELNKCIKLMEK